MLSLIRVCSGPSAFALDVRFPTTIPSPAVPFKSQLTRRAEPISRSMQSAWTCALTRMERGKIVLRLGRQMFPTSGERSRRVPQPLLHWRIAFPIRDRIQEFDGIGQKSAQAYLEEKQLERREGDKALELSLLAGIVFDASSEPMTPTHAVKKGTRYRYYISRRLITGPASDSSRGQRPMTMASRLDAGTRRQQEISEKQRHQPGPSRVGSQSEDVHSLRLDHDEPEYHE